MLPPDRAVSDATHLLSQYQYYLSRGSIAKLFDVFRNSASEGRHILDIRRVFSASEDLLWRWSQPPQDEGWAAMSMNVYLWRQRLGDIDPTQRVRYLYGPMETGYFEHTFRYMSMNGYAGIENIETTTYEAIVSFGQLIEELLGFHRKPGYREEAYFEYLARWLAILGPKVKRHSRVSEVQDLLDYISTEYATDDRLRDFDPALFAMLLHDMAFPPERARAAFEHFVLKAGNHSPMFFPAWWYGYRIFGPGILPVLRRVKVALGWDVLEPIITEDSGL